MKLFMEWMRMMCRRTLTTMRTMRMRKRRRRRRFLPEVHNPPSLFGGEFRRRRGFTIQRLEAMEAANVCRSPTHPVEDEIEVENCLFDDPRNIVVEDPVVVDRSRIVLE